MRQGQQNRRGRNRGGGQGGGSGGGAPNGGGGNMNNGNNNNRRPQNSLNRSYESSGPDIKIRGTAMHIAEKYATLARDAMSSGDSVAAENYLQHAEHYNRIILASQPMPQPQSNMPDGLPQQANGNGYRYQPNDGFNRDFDGDRGDDSDDDGIINPRPSFLERSVNYHQQPQPVIPQQAFPQNQNQPAAPIRINGSAGQPHAQPQPQVSPQTPVPAPSVQPEGVEGDPLTRRPRRRRPVMGETAPRPVTARNGRMPSSSDDTPATSEATQSQEPRSDETA